MEEAEEVCDDVLTEFLWLGVLFWGVVVGLLEKEGVCGVLTEFFWLAAAALFLLLVGLEMTVISSETCEMEVRVVLG